MTAAAAPPDHRLEEARAIRIEDEAARRGIKLRGVNERSGPCPACGGEDRFSINIKKQLWNCRGCQTGGDVIALVRHLDGVSFEDALEMLAGRPAARRLDAKPYSQAPSKSSSRVLTITTRTALSSIRSSASSIRTPIVPMFPAKRTSPNAAPIRTGPANGFTTSATPGAFSIACRSWSRL